MDGIEPTHIDDPSASIYAHGLCHIHAIACSRVHEGDAARARFLIVTDAEHTHWENPADPDDVVAAVIHVYYLHRKDGLVIARDVFGDRSMERAEQECAERYGLQEPDSWEVTLDELISFTEGHESAAMRKTGADNPLAAVAEQNFTKLIHEESVTRDFDMNIREEEPCL